MTRFLLPLLGLLCSTGAIAQTIEFEDCRISAGPGMPSMQVRCTTLARPLDPSGEVGGEIELRIAVVPALDLTPEPDPALSQHLILVDMISNEPTSGLYIAISAASTLALGAFLTWVCVRLYHREGLLG